MGTSSSKILVAVAVRCFSNMYLQQADAIQWFQIVISIFYIGNSNKDFNQ